MKVRATRLPGVLLVEPQVFEDDRGAFFETFQAEKFRALGLEDRFVQDNHSHSLLGVLRGLHYQLRQPQIKIIRVVSGEVFDVAVDLRRGSPTFGQWVGERLSAANRRMMYVPAGFAHGFLTLSTEAGVVYKCSNFYAPGDEFGIAWNDPKIGIDWPSVGAAPVLNRRDASYPRLEAVSPDQLPAFPG